MIPIANGTGHSLLVTSYIKHKEFDYPSKADGCCVPKLKGPSAFPIGWGRKNMTELQEETIQINYHIMKEYLERHYPNTKDSLYRNFCTNYSYFIKTIGDIDLYTISELFQYFVNKTLKNDCDIVEGR